MAKWTASIFGILLLALAFGGAAPAQECSEAWQWLNPLPHGDGLNGVSWSGGLFVAVGDAGRIQSSGDGTHWAYSARTTSAALVGVCRGDARWVAVGAGGTVLASDSGVDWAAIPSGTSNPLLAVTSAASQFVAVGLHGTIVTSPDGLSWTVRQAPGPSGWPLGEHLFKVAWGGGLFVATGSGGTVVTSPDGRSWTARSAAGAEDLTALAYGPSYFLAASRTGKIYRSADGMGWEEVGPPAEPLLEPRGLLWDGSKFLACGTWFIASSPDGNLWTQAQVPAAGYLDGLAWDGRAHVAVGSGGALLVSTDGTSWQNLTGGETPTFETIAHGDPGLVAAGYGSIFASSDGSIWERACCDNGEIVGAAAFGDGRFVAVASEGWIYTSADGKSWKTRRPYPYGGFLTGVAYGHGRFVAVGPHRIMTSHDGIRWTKHRTGKALAKVTWSGSLFVAVGYGGAILTSPDGVVWRSRSSGGTWDLADVCYGPLGFVAVGGNIILTSPDGTTWTATCVWSDGGDLNAVAQGGGAVLVAGSCGPYLSRDGVAWTPVTVATGNTIRALTYFGGAFYAAGDEGSLLRTPCP